jgi:hypothetical protein
MAVVGVGSFVLLVTVLPQIASSLGLRSLANRLDVAASCSSSGSSASGSSSSSCSSSSTTPPVTGALSGTITVTGVPSNVKIKTYYVYACPEATPWTTGSPPATCSVAESAKKSNAYDFPALTPGDYLLYPGYITKGGGGYVRMKTTQKPSVIVLPSQTVMKDMTLKYHS